MALEELLRQHEFDCDPPDSIDRLLARKIAKLSGEPDPYGTAGMSEAERRARDWADHREKQRPREVVERPVDRPQYGLRELRAPETMNTSNHERKQEQVA
jgi:hypothetical protein